MAKRIKRTQIVDAVSGEILREDRETIYTSEAYKPGQGYRLYSRRHTRLGKNWNHRLDLYTEGALSLLVRAMDESNMVPDMGKLAEMLGVSPRRVYQLLLKLREHGAIAKVPGGYVVNPAVAFGGAYLSPQLYRLFRPDLVGVVPPWAKALYDKEEPK